MKKQVIKREIVTKHTRYRIKRKPLIKCENVTECNTKNNITEKKEVTETKPKKNIKKEKNIVSEPALENIVVEDTNNNKIEIRENHE